MRFIDPVDEVRLNTLVSEGIVARDELERHNPGDVAVFLIEAISKRNSCVKSSQWLALGVRKGLIRLNNSKVTEGFIKDHAITEPELEPILASWCFPFAKNSYGQLLIAQAPNWPSVNTIPERHKNSKPPIFCIATIQELTVMYKTYQHSV